MVLAALLGGCGGGPAVAGPGCPLPVRVRWVAGDRLNPDEDGRPLPTHVRVHQLSSLARLDELELEGLWGTPDESLGPDQIAMQSGVLFPEQSVEMDVELDPEAKYVVGVALVRRPTGRLFRSVVVLPPPEERCALLDEPGPPNPAIEFRVQDYRVAARSRLGPGSSDGDPLGQSDEE